MLHTNDHKVESTLLCDLFQTVTLSNVTVPASAGWKEPKAAYQAERIPETPRVRMSSTEDIMFIIQLMKCSKNIASWSGIVPHSISTSRQLVGPRGSSDISVFT